MNNKRGIFFSTDAMVALIIILLVITIAIPLVRERTTSSNFNKDILESLSSLKIGEAANIPNHLITDPNNTVLEQIGEFYITNLTASRELASLVLSDVETKRNIGIWYGNTLIFSSNSTPFESAKNVETARQIISGIQEGANITGFSARSFLESSLLKKYFYFGGYVGDGNLSLNLDYQGNVTRAEIEVAINNDFEIFINGISIGTFAKSPDEFTPIKYEFDVSNLNSGNNTIDILGNNLHISGGFIKITYENDVEFQKPKRYNFPGTEGLINLYDGFYIPGNLTSLKIYLKIENNFTTTFLKIGNITVFENDVTGEQDIVLENEELSSILDYSKLSEKTTPIRLGLRNISSNLTLDADIFSVTDLSASMANSCVGSSFWCCLSGGDIRCGEESLCLSCGGEWEERLTSVKNANNLFISSILNNSENRVGLVGYHTQAPNSDYHPLSDDETSLTNKVSEWEASGLTCICCGINKAVEDLSIYSSSEALRSMVVMSDGIANIQCAEQSTGNAKNDAIQAACDAADNNITVYTVGFSEGADETTLQAMASCGGGSYYYSDVSEIYEVYEELAEEIIATYIEQTLEIVGELDTKLYPDSYIEFTYSQPEVPFGFIITLEKQFDDNGSGNFTIPKNSTIVETVVTSYSGPKWTKEVTINGNKTYDIDSYGEDYISLGDPYSINIPNQFILPNNTVTITTASSPTNSSPGSSSNKIIYTIAKNIISFSPISANAEGCIWNIDFEDGTNITAPIPSGYSGIENCFYQEGNIVEPEIDRDAFQTAVFNLLEDLDFNENGRVDITFTDQDLQISLTELTGIPYTWSTEAQARIWD